MKKGDFLLVHYTGRVAETGEIFDLTKEDVAKKEKVFIPGHKYKPAPVIIGAGMIIRGVERQLESIQPGKEKRFTVPPEEAFGRRDPKLIRIISMAQFIRQNINPVPGAYVTIDGLRARIQSVSGGRVRVDFNDPLAGKRLDYTIRITRVVRNPKDKLRLLLQRYGIKAEISLNPKTKQASGKTETPLKETVQKILQDLVRKWIPEVKGLSFSVKQKGRAKKGPGEAEKPKKPSEPPQQTVSLNKK